MILTSNPNRCIGATLIEALVSLLVLTIGLVSVILLLSYLTGTATLAKQRSEATFLAENMIEAARSFATLGTEVGFTSFDEIVSGSDTVMGINTEYNRNWIVETDPLNQYKTLTVTVNWMGALRESDSISLSTIIARYDPKITAAQNNSTIPLTP